MDAEGAIFVVVVSMIIITISSSYLNVYISAIYHQDPTYFYIYCPIYLIIIILLLVSYYRAVFTSPGYADSQDVCLPHQEWQIHASANLSLQAKCRKTEGKKGGAQKESIHLRVYILRLSNNQIAELKETVYCEKCQAVKLPRVHHCKICAKCILRMDHHCPWVGNCIGIYNHKFFMLFLLYATIGLTMTWVTLCIDWHFDWRFVSTFHDQQIAVYLMVIVTIASIILSLSIGSLFIAQVIGLRHNLTTLETFIPLIELDPPFDQGDWQTNFHEIFGSSLWLFPTKPDIQYPQY